MEIEPRTGNGRSSEVWRTDVVERSRSRPVAREYREEREHDGGRDGESLANFLGWFSIGLGLAQVMSPERMARMVGAREDDESAAVMRAVGFRELVSGIGILSNSHPTGWVRARVGGDIMDLALLAPLLSEDNPERRRSAGAAAAVIGAAALDAVCAQQLSRSSERETRSLSERTAGVSGKGIRHRNSVTIGKSPAEIYAFWRNFENLPRFMRHLESVQVTDDGRSHWRARAPAGRTVEWDAEITEDRPDELIAWRSLPGADIDNEGWVRFTPAPGGRGTEVRVHFAYDAPGGTIGSTLAKLFREEPGQQVADDLRHLKQVLETGDVVVSDATLLRGTHPAQPRERPNYRSA